MDFAMSCSRAVYMVIGHPVLHPFTMSTWQGCLCGGWSLNSCSSWNPHKDRVSRVFLSEQFSFPAELILSCTIVASIQTTYCSVGFLNLTSY